MWPPSLSMHSSQCCPLSRIAKTVHWAVIFGSQSQNNGAQSSMTPDMQSRCQQNRSSLYFQMLLVIWPRNTYNMSINHLLLDLNFFETSCTLIWLKYPCPLLICKTIGVLPLLSWLIILNVQPSPINYKHSKLGPNLQRCLAHNFARTETSCYACIHGDCKL